MSDTIVLVCATGRSGSTTMQRILNTIPNSNICGENYGAINSLMEFYLKLHITTNDYTIGNYTPISYADIVKQNIKPSWYNSYNINKMEDCIRESIIQMFKKDESITLWGFKEIRYEKNKIKLLQYFKNLFPQTKVIIQIREDVYKQSKSGWHKNDKNAPKYLEIMNKEFIQFYNQNKEWCYFTTFEKMFDLNNIKNIFKFIGCEDSYDETKVNEILNNNLKD